MDIRRVFIVGDSLFAETLAQTLKEASSAVSVLGATANLEAALPLVQTHCPDAVILAVAGVGDPFPASLSQLFASHPNLPIIYASPSSDVVQMITSQRVGASSSDLLAAIIALPKRR